MHNMIGVHGLPQGFPQNVGFAPNSSGKVLQNPKPKPEKRNSAVNYYGDFGGCGWWRMYMPEMLINFSKRGIISGMHKLIPDENFYADVKSVRLQRQATPEHAEFLRYLKIISGKYGFKLIYEVDDIVFNEDIPDFNKAKGAFESDEIRNSIVEMMNNCDVLTVSCEFMKNYYQEKLDHPNIQVIKNMPAKFWFDGYYDKTEIMKNYNDSKLRPRILYAGSGNHFDIDKKGRDDDFTHVLDQIIKSRKDYQWIFLGSIPSQLLPYVRSGEIIFNQWSAVPNYPLAMKNLKVNAVVAPLMDCTFNKAKSNIKFLESACLGIPGVFQDMITYDDAPIKFTDGEDMIKKLDKLFDNRKYYASISKKSRNYAEQMWLDDNIDQYTDLYFN